MFVEIRFIYIKMVICFWFLIVILYFYICCGVLLVNEFRIIEMNKLNENDFDFL